VTPVLIITGNSHSNYMIIDKKMFVNFCSADSMHTWQLQIALSKPMGISANKLHTAVVLDVFHKTTPRCGRYHAKSQRAVLKEIV
jgi:hypothetical protein